MNNLLVEIRKIEYRVLTENKKIQVQNKIFELFPLENNERDIQDALWDSNPNILISNDIRNIFFEAKEMKKILEKLIPYGTSNYR